jgi:hypothetical protein
MNHSHNFMRPSVKIELAWCDLQHASSDREETRNAWSQRALLSPDRGWW